MEQLGSLANSPILIKVFVGLFIFLVTFGLLIKSRILGKKKSINFLVALILGIVITQSEFVVNSILNLSSNISALIIAALIFVMIMSLSSISALAMFMFFALLVLFLAIFRIYPFSIITIYISEFVAKALILAIIISILFWWLFKK